MFKQDKGFTLVELMITVAIVAIVLAVAAPNLVEFVQGNKATTLTNTLVSNLNLARSEAAKRGYNVTICVRNTAGTACDPTAKNYAAGMMIFTDYSDSTQPTPNRNLDDASVLYDLDNDGTKETAEELIAITGPLAEDTVYNIIQNRAITTNPLSAITYFPTGQAAGTRAFSISINKILSASSSELAARVFINFGGRARACVVKYEQKCTS